MTMELDGKVFNWDKCEGSQELSTLEGIVGTKIQPLPQTITLKGVNRTLIFSYDSVKRSNDEDHEIQCWVYYSPENEFALYIWND